MGKLVILKFYKNVEGFQAILEISREGRYLQAAVNGRLPPLTALTQNYQNWLAAYAQIGQPSRVLRPVSITLEGTLTTRRKRCLALAEQLRLQFDQWLQASSFQPVRDRLLRELQDAEPVRFIVQSADDGLFKLPWQRWELLEPLDAIEVGFSALDYEYLPSDPPTAAPLKILAVFGHAVDLNLEPDRAALAQLPGAEVKFLVECSRQDLSDALWNQRWDMLFFAGHSHTEADQGYLDLNATDRLTLAELKATLGQAVRQGLRLAMFNSCDGLGLAQALRTLGIPQIVVMREPVPDLVAQAFLNYFLQAFSGGASLPAAIRQGREKLEGLEDRFPCASWLPLLIQNPTAPPLRWPTHLPTHLAAQPASQPASQPSSQLPSSRRAIWRRSAITSLLTTLGVMTLRLWGGLQPLELGAYDGLMRLKPDEPIDSRLLLVEVTEENLRQYGEATLSDQRLAEGLRILEANGASVIGVDIFRDIPQEPGSTQLRQQLQQSKRTFVICQHPEAGVDPGSPPPAQTRPDQIGFSDVVLDADDIVRRHLFSMAPAERSACETEYALSLLLAASYLETVGLPESGRLANALEFGKVRLEGLTAPAGTYRQQDLGGYQELLHYRRSNQSVNQLAQSVTFDALLEGRVPGAAIANRIVLIGITAQSHKDEFRTPYDEKIKGVALHAQMTSQIVSAVLDGRPLLWTWPWVGDWLWVVGWSSLGASVIGFCSSSRQFWLTEAGLVLVLSAICVIAFLQAGLWLPWIPSLIGLIIASGLQQKISYSDLKI
jgi:CHASE2 domain-containing sensor protein